MTTARPEATLFGGVALLERAVGYTLGQLRAVTPAALSRPTPCQAWDLRALLLHMNDSLATMQQALDLKLVSPDPGPRAADPADGLVAALQARACQLLGALASGGDDLVWIGGYPLPVRIVTSTGAIEVAVHGWDAGQACGMGGTIPEQLARDMLRVSTLLVTSTDRPGRFAAPVALPPYASVSDCLLGYLGRDPGWLPPP